jgi:hypothetical protein
VFLKALCKLALFCHDGGNTAVVSAFPAARPAAPAEASAAVGYSYRDVECPFQDEPARSDQSGLADRRVRFSRLVWGGVRRVSAAGQRQRRTQIYVRRLRNLFFIGL